MHNLFIIFLVGNVFILVRGLFHIHNYTPPLEHSRPTWNQLFWIRDIQGCLGCELCVFSINSKCLKLLQSVAIPYQILH